MGKLIKKAVIKGVGCGTLLRSDFLVFLVDGYVDRSGQKGLFFLSVSFSFFPSKKQEQGWPLSLICSVNDFHLQLCQSPLMYLSYSQISYNFLIPLLKAILLRFFLCFLLNALF